MSEHFAAGRAVHRAGVLTDRVTNDGLPPIDIRASGDTIKFNYTTHVVGHRVDDIDFSRQGFEVLELKPGTGAFIETDQNLKLTSDVAGLIYTRLSDATFGLVITPTVIPPGFNGLLRLFLSNVGNSKLNILKHGKIAQLLLVRAEALK
ncbi:hypothetical protein [Agrobacterium tumefaciens]|uniref:hypothetical protein n=1 Tax=Agrobacterium tumefaciens TaxID=358 RepID=UPI00046FCA38